MPPSWRDFNLCLSLRGGWRSPAGVLECRGADLSFSLRAL